MRAAWWIAGGVVAGLGVLYVVGRSEAQRQAEQAVSTTDRLIASQTQRPPTTQAVTRTPSGSELEQGVGIALTAYRYLKQAWDVYTAGGTVAEYVATEAASSAGTVTGDVLGTGALTTTAPDILLPVGSIATETTALGVDAGVLATEVGIEAGAPLAEVGGGVAVTATTGAAEAGAAGTAAAVGESAAVVGAELGATAALGIAAAWLGLGFVIEKLVNLGLNEYKRGDLSKAIMNAKQEAIRSYGNAALQGKIAAAPGFAAAIDALRIAPGQGQVQYGIGDNFAGVNDAPATSTPGWLQICDLLRRPEVLTDRPDLIADFVANLWVQTGASGVASFDKQNTMAYRALILSKLPYTPAWNGFRQVILNAPVVDPRDVLARDLAYASVPELPADVFLRVGNCKLDTRDRWGWYNVWHEPPDHESSYVEVVALELARSWPGYQSDQNTSLVTRNGVFISIYDPATARYHTDPTLFDMGQACSVGAPLQAFADPYAMMVFDGGGGDGGGPGAP